MGVFCAGALRIVNFIKTGTVVNHDGVAVKMHYFHGMYKAILPICVLLTLGCSNDSKPKSDVMDNRNASKPVAWAHSTNIYEVNVRQYTPEGTFNAFASELSRLKDMGVQTLWFMPITPIAQKNKKGTLGS